MDIESKHQLMFDPFREPPPDDGGIVMLNGHPSLCPQREPQIPKQQFRTIGAALRKESQHNADVQGQ